MSTSVLVGYATNYGSMQEFAEAVAATMRFPINLLTGDEPASDLRDWTAIRAWAKNLTAKLEPALS
jgi:menaquinone-dependent protoporphyrinogen IX oxidase